MKKRIAIVLFLCITACGETLEPQAFSVSVARMQELYDAENYQELQGAAYKALSLASSGDDSSRAYCFLYLAVAESKDIFAGFKELIHALGVRRFSRAANKIYYGYDFMCTMSKDFGIQPMRLVYRLFHYPNPSKMMPLVV